MIEPWVLSQQRTMARWVSSKISREIHDISTDLCDGLALLELVNKLASESKASSIKLKPTHYKPRVSVQKLENVLDALKYCRLLLKINLCNISAEDVVSGNTKLILGLIWSLFMYSSSSMVSVKSESRSFAEIKSILLRWLNFTCKAKAIPEITNFNKDWSLQQEKRPDLVFAAVLDFYVPKLITFEKYLGKRRLAGLKEIISLAETSLGIPDLALAEDFNVLVPVEKCILFYVLEWYTFFEIQKKEVPLELILESRDVPERVHCDFGSFFSSVLRAVKLRNIYDTKSLHLSNRLSSHLNQSKKRLQVLDLHSTDTDFEVLVNNICATIDESKELEPQLKTRCHDDDLEKKVRSLQTALSESFEFQLRARPAIMYSDFPELQNITKNLNSILKEGGFPCSYEPHKALSIESLSEKVRQLVETEAEICSKIDSNLSRLFDTNARNIDELITKAAKSLPRADESASEIAQVFASRLDLLLGLKTKMQEYRSMISQEHTTSDLRTLAKSIAFYDLPKTPQTPKESQFISFCQEVSYQVNRSNLTFVDLRKFLQKLMPVSQFQGPELQEFIRLIPSRAYLPRSESNEFGTVCHSDDSDDSEAIFDRVSRTLECKLSGAQGKIYDLSLLVDRMEHGFKL